MSKVYEIQKKLGDLVEIEKPDPDSQYRLRPCACGSSDVYYICYGYYAFYTAVCNTCGKQTTLNRTKHHAQIEWNGGERPSWERD